jgi:hypothetical protein
MSFEPFRLIVCSSLSPNAKTHEHTNFVEVSSDIDNTYMVNTIREQSEFGKKSGKVYHFSYSSIMQLLVAL